MNAKLNVKQWTMATAAVFVIFVALALLQNKVILPAPTMITETPGSASSDSMGRILVYLSRLLTAAVFTYIFTKSSDGKAGVAHGARYGLGIGLLMVMPFFLSGFEYSGLSASTHIISRIVDLIGYTICGVVTAQLYKPAQK